MSSGPALVERRAGERRKGDRRKSVETELASFITRCRLDGVEVEVQDVRMMHKGKILAEDETRILMQTVGQHVLLFKRGISSVAKRD